MVSVVITQIDYLIIFQKLREFLHVKIYKPSVSSFCFYPER